MVHRTLKRTDRILVVGCGNSNFSAELYDDGFEEVSELRLGLEWFGYADEETMRFYVGSSCCTCKIPFRDEIDNRVQLDTSVVPTAPRIANAIRSHNLIRPSRSYLYWSYNRPIF